MITNDQAHSAAITQAVQGVGLLAGLGKFLGLTATSFGIGGALATVVVMCLKRPRTGAEWAVALISTLVASFGGGAFAILHFNLLQEAKTIIDVFAVIGIVFLCGLPGWLLVRLFFTQMGKAESDGKGLVDVVKDIKGAL